MPLFWRPQLRVGHDGIDQDHRHLILLINTVELVLRFPEQPDNLRQALDDLHAFAVEHFDREERLQLACSYPHYDEHRREHQRLLSALDELRTRPNLADQGLNNQRSDEITTFLRHWLVDHVVKADLRMCDLFRKRPPLR